MQVDASDLKLIPPAAGAFWTPKKPPPYDPTLPNYPVVYSEQEKDTQRKAYEMHHQGLKDAIAAGWSSYTFPPGVYRSSEKISIEVSALLCMTPDEGFKEHSMQGHAGQQTLVTKSMRMCRV